MEIVLKRKDFVKLMEKYIQDEFGEQFQPISVQFFTTGERTPVEVKQASVKYVKKE
ncbi:hypothetical protein [Sutcliffiella sp. NC1]|uniref:hypothetical protein n=1 Tax=Sutcliffiella sp. NC1 TaxID=3004096 RepID=UPI0022DE3838|nr:hypothetical protein [Sutcliffiella sp. NC1]WBL16354.1 hypothetical protein O1A01_06900 [Sutcliffiella sp. NC1]